MKPSIPVGIKLSYLLIMRLDEGRLGDIEKPIQRATILYIVKKKFNFNVYKVKTYYQ
jgi:hypothetical protein